MDNIVKKDKMYNEPEKNKIREDIIRNSIDILTKRRKDSTISKPDYIKKVQKFMLNESTHETDKHYGVFPTNKTFLSWEKYYKSLLMNRSASNLKVAFLAGPNPENDIKMFVKYGILEENIWAFEADDSLYEGAVDNLILNFSRAKIYKGKIENFFLNTPIKFDIIYLDFCCPIMSKRSKSIITLVSLIKSHALNSPGVVVTNFALPSYEQNSVERIMLAKLAALYLYPKTFINNELSLSEEGMEVYEWLKKVEGNFEFFYGEFISRFIMDLSTVIVPFSKFASNEAYFNSFFKLSKDEKKKCIRNLFFQNEDYELGKDEYEEKDVIHLSSIDELFMLLEGEKYVTLSKSNNEGKSKRNSIYDDFGGWVNSDCDYFSIPWCRFVF